MDIQKVEIKFIQKGFEEVKGFFNFTSRETTLLKGSPVRPTKLPRTDNRTIELRAKLESDGCITGNNIKKSFNKDYTFKPEKTNGTTLSPAASVVLYRGCQGTEEINFLVDGEWLPFYDAQERLGLVSTRPKTRAGWRDYKNYCKQSGNSPKTADNYAAWLNRIEHIFNTQLENEYKNDKCEQIVKFLEDSNEIQKKGIKVEDAKNYLSALKKFLEFKGDKQGLSFEDGKGKSIDEKPKFPLNQILYGPPGTGKTYNTIDKTIEIIKGEKVSHDEALKLYRNDYKEQIEFVTFHQSYGYEEFIQGIKPIVIGKGDERKVIYKVEDGIFKEFCDKANKDKNNNYVFIIDEINRGNVSKIFGELITLIEESKRIGAKEEMQAVLPYRDENNEKVLFGVPNNVYILGTMNTADRSLVQLDAALRRRFRFEEMMPDYGLLEANAEDGINVQKLLREINKKIRETVDREHQIGHSYLIGVKTKEKLKEVFKNEIIPLLQEYFYEDYDNIKVVLGDQKFTDEEQKIDLTNFSFKRIYGENEQQVKDEQA